MTTKRALACIAMMGTLMGCANQVGFGEEILPPPSLEEFDDANFAYVDCLMQTADRIDDGKLSPIGLALKVIPLCEMQFATLEGLTARGYDRYSGHQIRNGLEQNKEEFVTSVVLRLRLNRQLP